MYIEYSPHDLVHAIVVLIALTSNDGSDDSAHMCRLARAFAAHTHTQSM